MKITINKKWLIILIMALPVLALSQTSRSGNRNGATILGHSKYDNSAVPIVNSVDEVDDEGEWLHYDDGDNEDSWGFLISGEEYDVASKWDPVDLSDYDGWVITKIKFIVVSSGPLIAVKVWEGPNATEIYSQDVPSFNVNSWTEVVLDTAVEFDVNTELWAGYYVDFTSSELGGFVTATDDGPPVDEYGNLFRWNGDWYSDYNNHNLQVYIESNLSADFEANDTTICPGGTVNFTNLSINAETYDWIFEGGTPATSTQEDPVITYNTPGTYDVQLTINAGSSSNTELKSDYITVYGALVAPATPTGPGEACGTYSYQYMTESVQYAESYDWEVSPEAAGTMSGDDTVGTFIASNTWSGSYTIKVRAENQCGDGPWSPDFTGILSHDPVVFDLQGDGAYCEGESGAEITLSDSESDISYELFKDNVTTGVIIAGTGDPVSFGFYEETGLYTATGFNDNCFENMVGQIYVHMEPVPGQAVMPEGDESVCIGESSDYSTSGAADADDYTWVLDPEEAGVMSPDGDEVSVVWDEAFSGTAYLSVFGTNDCGDGTPSDDLAIMVNPLPEPVVSGLSLVCDNDESNYSTDDNAGSSYTWEVTGGSIISGAGTYSINVLWGYPGDGSVAVTEVNTEGCEGTSSSLAVTIDDCTGIEENSSSLIRLYPNPANDKVTITGLNEATIKVYNLLGKEIYSIKEARGQQSINTSSYVKGLYLVKVEQDEELSVFQLIKR